MRADKYTVEGLENKSAPDIEGNIRAHAGIKAVRIDTEVNTVTVDYDDLQCSAEQIKSYIGNTGLTVREVNNTFNS